MTSGDVSVTRFVTETPWARMPLLYSLFARLPGAAIGVLLPLLGLSGGMSATVSASAFAACRIAQALAGPAWGKLVDRTGLTLIVPVVGCCFAGSVAVLAVIPLSPVVLVAMAAVIGALTLPMSALMRALWNRSLESANHRDAANSIESLMSEVVLLLGRVLVAVAALLVSLPHLVLLQAAVAVAGSIGLASTVLVRTDPGTERRSANHRKLSQVRSRTSLFACFLLFSGSLGAYSLALILLVDTITADYAATLSASAIAVWGLGSVVGLTLGRLSSVTLHHRSGCILLLLATAVLQLLAVVGHFGPVFLLLSAFLAGLPISAILTGLYAQLGAAVPLHQHTEYFAWATTMIFAGDAAGALAVGIVNDLVSGSLAAVAVAAGASVSAAIAAAISLRSNTHPSPAV